LDGADRVGKGPSARLRAAVKDRRFIGQQAGRFWLWRS